MSFNLKKHAKTNTEKALQKQREEFDQTDSPISTTDKQLKPLRKNEDKPLTEKQLEETHTDTLAGITESQMNAYFPGEGLSKREGHDQFDQLPINLLEEKRQKERAKAYIAAQDKDEETEFWDGFITQDIKNAPSQLHNHPSRFRNLSEDDILKNEGVKKMVMASLVDADAMIYYVYRNAAEQSRKITDEEQSMINQLSAEKVKIISALKGG